MKPSEKPKHIECEKGQIAENVLMAGDPLRAKYIAEKYLENPVLVNTIRNMYAYTGTYKGKRITVMGHGMGIPSMCIYAFELIYYYGVKRIIRTGTGGVIHPGLRLGDIVLATDAYSESSYAFQYDGNVKIVEEASASLNEKIEKVAKEKDIDIVLGTIVTTDIFGPYAEIEKLLDRVPPDVEPKAEEMEAFGLFYLANKYNIEATCLITMVDSKYSRYEVAPAIRERGLDEMIILGLEALILE